VDQDKRVAGTPKSWSACHQPTLKIDHETSDVLICLIGTWKSPGIAGNHSFNTSSFHHQKTLHAVAAEYGNIPFGYRYVIPDAALFQSS
jgi:hypothetical protein